MRRLRFGIVLVVLSLFTGKAAAIGSSYPAPDSALMAAHPDRIYYQPYTKYTLGDLFSALDLPTCFGVSYTPYRMESVSFYGKMCLEWRQRKNYGWFGAVNIDNHSCRYHDLQLKDHKQVNDVNVVSGEVWYYDICLGPGYRFPLVRDIREFYEHPYLNRFNLSFIVQPGITIPHVKHVDIVDASNPAEIRYSIKDKYNIVPSMKFSAAFECFVSPKFSIFVEGSYIQHLKPTIIEKAFYDYEHNARQAYAGPLIFCIGFAGFFN